MWMLLITLGTVITTLLTFALSLRKHDVRLGSQFLLIKKILNFDLLKKSLSIIGWDGIFDGVNDVNSLWAIFHKVLSSAVAQCTTLKLLKSRPCKKTNYPHSIKKLVSKKRKLWKKFKLFNDDSSKILYTNCSKELSNAIRLHEVNSEQKVIATGNPSALFRLVKQKTGVSRDIPPFHVGGDLVNNNLDKANILNDLFTENFIVDNGVTPAFKSRCNHCFDTVAFSSNTIIDVLCSFKNSHAPGPDGFSASFYKTFAYELHKPLFRILDTSIKSGKLPECWKKARVIPVFKKGNAADAKNYRPISLTCVPCKVLERIICKQLLNFLNEHELLDPSQFGFTPGRSTTLQLLQCLDDWTSGVEAGASIDTIMIDYAKAFDSVSHNKLCHKLVGYGISGNILLWITNFLSGRTQCVCIGTSASDVARVTSGVPQGSILGPLLFLLYINDLKSINPNVIMPKFADDLKLYRRIFNNPDYHELVFSLKRLESWSAEWQLPISASKCKVFPIGTKNKFLNYNLMGAPLEHMTDVKDLGVWFSSDLKCATHCNHIVKSARQRSAIIRRAFVSRDRKTLFWAFCVFVRPILEYASPVWSPYLIKDIDHVESVQRQFTKYLPGLKLMSYGDRLRILNADSLERRRLYCDLALAYSLLHGLCNVDHSKFFELRSGGRTRGHPFKMKIQLVRRDYRKFFFSNRVARVWNELPENVVMAPTLLSFKSRLRVVCLDQYLRWA